ncbi:MAG: NAD-dependent epimerase/dehydratase family protein [Dehalococcoidales bacterium]|nr:NAD-dependent epimerase/dehydratase family protein [Dehalococcoidales bacterium]
MNILVTGGSGFIGSHVVDKLIDAGHSVRVLDTKKPAYRDDVEYIKGDITLEKDIKKSISGIDTVCHIAAFADINRVKGNPLLTVKYNIMGTAYLLEECRKQRVKRFLLASTVFIYDERGHLYTTSKAASEMLCRNYQLLYSLPYTILRYGTAYGPRSRGDDVIALFVKRALNGQNLVIHGKGKQKRNLTYVEDLASGTVAALADVAENRTYTLVNERSVSIKELAETVRKIVNNKIAIEFDSSRQDDYQGKIPDDTEIERQNRELGWEAGIDIEDGIKKYVDWYQKAGKIGTR